jgi:ABC-type Fe3+ transport system permease subunit
MLEWFDPSNWGISPEQYEHWWYFMLNTLFKGVWAKILATLSLSLSIYSVIRRKFRPVFALILFLTSVFFAYSGIVLDWVF